MSNNNRSEIDWNEAFNDMTNNENLGNVNYGSNSNVPVIISKPPPKNKPTAKDPYKILMNKGLTAENSRRIVSEFKKLTNVNAKGGADKIKKVAGVSLTAKNIRDIKEFIKSPFGVYLYNSSKVGNNRESQLSENIRKINLMRNNKAVLNRNTFIRVHGPVEGDALYTTVRVELMRKGSLNLNKNFFVKKYGKNADVMYNQTRFDLMKMGKIQPNKNLFADKIRSSYLASGSKLAQEMKTRKKAQALKAMQLKYNLAPVKTLADQKLLNIVQRKNNNENGNVDLETITNNTETILQKEINKQFQNALKRRQVILNQAAKISKNLNISKQKAINLLKAPPVYKRPTIIRKKAVQENKSFVDYNRPLFKRLAKNPSTSVPYRRPAGFVNKTVELAKNNKPVNNKKQNLTAKYLERVYRSTRPKNIGPLNINQELKRIENYIRELKSHNFFQSSSYKLYPKGRPNLVKALKNAEKNKLNVLTLRYLPKNIPQKFTKNKKPVSVAKEFNVKAWISKLPAKKQKANSYGILVQPKKPNLPSKNENYLKFKLSDFEKYMNTKINRYTQNNNEENKPLPKPPAGYAPKASDKRAAVRLNKVKSDDRMNFVFAKVSAMNTKSNQKVNSAQASIIADRVVKASKEDLRNTIKSELDRVNANYNTNTVNTIIRYLTKRTVQNDYENFMKDKNLRSLKPRNVIDHLKSIGHIQNKSKEYEVVRMMSDTILSRTNMNDLQKRVEKGKQNRESLLKMGFAPKNVSNKMEAWERAQQALSGKINIVKK